MCFYIHPSHKDVKIADKDIVCYKRLQRVPNNDPKKGVFVSPFQGFLYDFNKKTIFSVNKFRIVPDRGVKKLAIEKGLHTYSVMPDHHLTFSDEDVFECVIPKGTKYYYNPSALFPEYVSLCIEFKKRLTFNLGDLRKKQVKQKGKQITSINF